MIKLTQKKIEKYTGDLIAFFVLEQKKGGPKCSNKNVQAMLNQIFKLGDFTGKEGQTFLYYPKRDANIAAKRVLVVGIGKDELSRETFRKCGGVISRAALTTKASSLLVQIPEHFDFDKQEMIECLTEGLLLGSYSFRKYKTKIEKDDEPGNIKEYFINTSKSKTIEKAFNAGQVSASAVSAARDMANEPGNKWTPKSFADFGLALAKKYQMSCKIFEKAEMKRLGMGGIIGVNSGSALPPKMVVLSHKVRKKSPTLLLVGKGLTFDSGGINLKPSNGLEEMKYDMCGGAAVLTVMQAIGEEKPKGLNVVAIIPATDNLPGPAALKPSDVITMYGGKTVEVINTDAEGRLILADAIAYGIEKYKPDAVIDLATLTGAVIIGLGHHRTGLLSNNADLTDKIKLAADRSGEPVWELPLGQEYSKQLKSEVADIKNIGNRTGGTITAAAFLQEFVGDTPWAHLDIAGTAWNFTEKPYIPKGPSGIGVRTLLDIIRHWE